MLRGDGLVGHSDEQWRLDSASAINCPQQPEARDRVQLSSEGSGGCGYYWDLTWLSLRSAPSRAAAAFARANGEKAWEVVHHLPEEIPQPQWPDGATVPIPGRGGRREIKDRSDLAYVDHHPATPFQSCSSNILMFERGGLVPRGRRRQDRGRRAGTEGYVKDLVVHPSGVERGLGKALMYLGELRRVQRRPAQQRLNAWRLTNRGRDGQKSEPTRFSRRARPSPPHGRDASVCQSWKEFPSESLTWQNWTIRDGHLVVAGAAQLGALWPRGVDVVDVGADQHHQASSARPVDAAPRAPW